MAATTTAEGKTKTEIMRCLKRYIAPEAFNLLADEPGGSSIAMIDARPTQLRTAHDAGNAGPPDGTNRSTFRAGGAILPR